MNEIYIKKEDLDRWIGKYFPSKDLISIDDLLECIEDLDSEIKELQLDLEKLKQDIQDNYKRKDVASQIGISEKMFH